MAARLSPLSLSLYLSISLSLSLSLSLSFSLSLYLDVSGLARMRLAHTHLKSHRKILPDVVRCQKCQIVSARDSRVRNGCINVMGAWHFVFFSAGQPPCPYIPRFRWGYLFFWGVVGGDVSDDEDQSMYEI